MASSEQQKRNELPVARSIIFHARNGQIVRHADFTAIELRLAAFAARYPRRHWVRVGDSFAPVQGTSSEMEGADDV